MRTEGCPIDQLTLKGGEEALAQGVVIAVVSRPHRGTPACAENLHQATPASRQRLSATGRHKLDDLVLQLGRIRWMCLLRVARKQVGGVVGLLSYY